MTIVAGFGFRASVMAQSFADAFEQASRGQDVDDVATVEDKADHPVLLAFAAERMLSVAGIPAPDLATQPTVTLSEASTAARGTGSVAEAAALAAAGPGARLLGPRAISADRRATCALAIQETE